MDSEDWRRALRETIERETGRGSLYSHLLHSLHFEIINRLFKTVNCPF